LWILFSVLSLKHPAYWRENLIDWKIIMRAFDASIYFHVIGASWACAREVWNWMTRNKFSLQNHIHWRVALLSMQFSHHSSNPLEARKSDPRNASYKARLQAAEAEAGYDESSDDPLAMTIKQQKYIDHLRETLGAELLPPKRGGPSDITPKPGVSRAAAAAKAQFVDLDASDDELALVDGDETTSDAKKVIKIETPRPYHWQTRRVPLDIAEDEEDADEIKAEEYAQEQEGDFFTGERFPDEDEDMHSIGDASRLGSLSPLTPLSSNQSSPYSSPQSSRPASPDEAATIKARPVEEQLEIQQEIEQLYDSVPEILDEYELIDRLGTGTFSSVYKAVDLRYNAWDNQPWLGHHPPESTAYYQSAGPGYKGRGGRASGWRQASHQMDEDKPALEGMHDDSPRNVYVAIKRIYTTSGPERIRNELSIMEACRGCRHTSQIITAFRNEDQVVIVLPYQRNMDFRVSASYFLESNTNGILMYRISIKRFTRKASNATSAASSAPYATSMRAASSTATSNPPTSSTTPSPASAHSATSASPPYVSLSPPSPHPTDHTHTHTQNAAPGNDHPAHPRPVLPHARDGAGPARQEPAAGPVRDGAHQAGAEGRAREERRGPGEGRLPRAGQAPAEQGEPRGHARLPRAGGAAEVQRANGGYVVSLLLVCECVVLNGFFGGRYGGFSDWCVVGGYYSAVFLDWQISDFPVEWWYWGVDGDRYHHWEEEDREGGHTAWYVMGLAVSSKTNC
jgi:hypothetical protein